MIKGRMSQNATTPMDSRMIAVLKIPPKKNRMPPPPRRSIMADVRARLPVKGAV
jgi:hypothetical protein